MPPELPPLPAHLNPRDPKKRGRSRLHTPSRHGSGGRDRHLRLKQVSLYGTMTIATLLSVALVIGTGIYWWNYRQFDNGISKINISLGQNSDSHAVKKDIDGKDENILVVGNDDRTGDTPQQLAELNTNADGGSLATDTMMIIHVPANGSKATLISLPRDSYVNIPGYGMDKLNAAYDDGFQAATGTHLQKVAAGANLLIETIQNLTGLHIDHYAMINLIGFYTISKAIGGIKVDMCEAVNDPYSGANFHAGINIISGQSALAFVRQRHGLVHGDLDRVKRQQYFLTAAFRQAFSGKVLVKLNDLLNAIKSSIVVDGGLDPLTLGQQMENLSANNIISTTIPTTIDNNSPAGDVLDVQPAQVQAFVLGVIGNTDPKLKTAPLVAPSTVTVSVENAGSGVNGVAAKNAAVLQAQGFHVGQPGDSQYAVTATTIEYANGMQSQAKTLAQYVPGALLVETNVAKLTLLLGPDGLSAKPLPPKPSTSPSPSTSKSPSPSPSTSKPVPAPKPIDASCVY